MNQDDLRRATALPFYQSDLLHQARADVRDEAIGIIHEAHVAKYESSRLQAAAAHHNDALSTTIKAVMNEARWVIDKIQADQQEINQLGYQVKKLEKNFTEHEIAAACMEADIPDSKFESLMIALQRVQA